jgi:membrane-associated phospholipid phosphatase
VIKKGLYSLILFFLITSNQINAQSSTSMWDDIKGDVSHSYHVGIGLLKSPFTASSSDWQRIGIATAGTGMLFLLDPAVKDFAQSNQSKTGDWIFNIDNTFNKEYVIIGSSGLYLSGLLFRQRELRHTALYTMEAVFLASSITAALKYTFGRSRPYLDEGQLKFHIFNGHRERYRSLPSGHTTGAFSICTVMAKSIDNNWWKTFWYGTAVMVGAARIYYNHHWLSDTVLGGFIGYTTANYVVHFDERNKNKKNSFNGHEIQPYFSINEFGVNLYF